MPRPELNSYEARSQELFLGHPELPLIGLLFKWSQQQELSQEEGMPSGSLLWLQGMQHLRCSLLLSQVTSRELDMEWNIRSPVGGQRGVKASCVTAGTLPLPFVTMLGFYSFGKPNHLLMVFCFVHFKW